MNCYCFHGGASHTLQSHTPCTHAFNWIVVGSKVKILDYFDCAHNNMKVVMGTIKVAQEGCGLTMGKDRGLMTTKVPTGEIGH